MHFCLIVSEEEEEEGLVAAFSSEINDGKSKWLRKLTGHNRIGK